MKIPSVEAETSKRTNRMWTDGKPDRYTDTPKLIVALLITFLS